MLRVSIGVIAIVQGAFYLTQRATWTLGALASCLLLLVSGASLVIGFLTPVMSILIGIATLCNAISFLPPPAGNLFDGKLTSLEVVIMAAAMALLGPGAFSVDARLFGRREIVIPAPSSRPKA